MKKLRPRDIGKQCQCRMDEDTNACAEAIWSQKVEIMKLRSKFEYKFQSSHLKKPIDHRVKPINYSGCIWIHLLPYSLRMEHMKRGLNARYKYVNQNSPSRHIKNKYRKRVAYQKTIWDVACNEERRAQTKEDESCIQASSMSTNRGNESGNLNNVVHTTGGGVESASNSTAQILPGTIDGALSDKGISVHDRSWTGLYKWGLTSCILLSTSCIQL